MATKSSNSRSPAASLEQRKEHSFFRMQAQVQMEFAFHVLTVASYAVTLDRAYGLLTPDAVLGDVMAMLAKRVQPSLPLRNPISR